MTQHTPIVDILPIGAPGSSERRAYMRSYINQYHPPHTGVHICAIFDDDEMQHGPHLTMASITMSAVAAMVEFGRIKSEYAIPDHGGEVVVDLMVGGDSVDQFWTRRQMVEPMKRGMTA